jgi:hypothetical protein
MKQLFSFACGLVLLLSACATSPKIDWQSRVGSYTYDQAVLEFGPPDKQAKLVDGTLVCEWLTWKGRAILGHSTYLGYGMVDTSGTTEPDYYTRLTFNPSGKLQSYKKYAK